MEWMAIGMSLPMIMLTTINLFVYRTLHDGCPIMKNSVAMPFLALTKTSGHFDLYESTICDLNKTFRFIETLWKN